MTDPEILELRERIERIELNAGIPRRPWKATRTPKAAPEPETERRGPGRPRKTAEG